MKKEMLDDTWNGQVTKSYNNFKRNMFSWIGTGCFALFVIIFTYMAGKVTKNESEIYRLDKKNAVIETKLDAIQKSTERIERKLNGHKK